MSKYTFELRRLFDFYTRDTVEGWFKSYNIEDYLTQDEIDVINERGTWSKDKLATKIVDHYYMREIGFETPYLFKHYVEITMKEIMERKLPLIYSASIEYDPLINVDYTETFNRNIADERNKEFSNSQTTSDSQSASGLTINSDTPQGQISKSNILDGKYASSTSASESSGSNSNTTSGSSTEDNTGNTEEESTKHVKGNSGVSATAQKMIQQYRENIIAIDSDIINELNDLFMGLY